MEDAIARVMLKDIIGPLMDAIDKQRNPGTRRPAHPTWIDRDLYNKAFAVMERECEYNRVHNYRNRATIPIQDAALATAGYENFLMFGAFLAVRQEASPPAPSVGQQATGSNDAVPGT